jgi:hypothetical protein
VIIDSDVSKIPAGVLYFVRLSPRPIGRGSCCFNVFDLAERLENRGILKLPLLWAPSEGNYCHMRSRAAPPPRETISICSQGLCRLLSPCFAIVVLALHHRCPPRYRPLLYRALLASEFGFQPTAACQTGMTRLISVLGRACSPPPFLRSVSWFP